MTRVSVGILGATGTVGQRFIELLENHPNFQLTTLGASPRSAGKLYGQAVNWKLSSDLPDRVSNLMVQECKPDFFKECRFVFSGLDSDVAGEIEQSFLDADMCVFSNAKNFRMDPLVPLCVPLVNPSHFALIERQRKEKELSKGFIVTNANCSTTGLVVPLKALIDAFGPLDKVMVTTLQAISGAGYPGVPSLDIFDNVVPYISGEESKLEEEPNKILGIFKANEIKCEKSIYSATCNRVAVLDGHTECVSLSFVNRPAPSLEQVRKAFEDYRPEYMNTHSAPDRAIHVKLQHDRPQPRLDRHNGKGQAVTVGRVRKCPILDFKFTLLSHNTVLGAAGSSIMNAEIALAKGLF